MTASPGRLELHEHAVISGPDANWAGRNRIVHSHEGGEVPHRHEHTGPASYTIDKDDWFRATGLQGGGRKQFTSAPTGKQLPTIVLTEAGRAFEVVVGPPPQGFTGTGAGSAPVARMVLAMGMKPVYRDGIAPAPPAGPRLKVVK